MKISYSPYTLQALTNLNAKADRRHRDGILLKVEDAEGRVGYADLHPWPELGDQDLIAQLTALRENGSSPLIRQSLWMAERDAQWRSQGQSIFDLGPTIKNNKTVTDPAQVNSEILQQWQSEGFEIVKLKMGRDLATETHCLNLLAEHNFKIRLDFNLSATQESFQNFLQGLSVKTREAIDYVEDPFPFAAKAWSEMRQQVPLAMDMPFEHVKWESFTEAPCDVLIVKPAKMDLSKALQISDRWNLKITVTSMMDHCVGELHALAVAMELKKSRGVQILQAGCMTHSLYQADSFSRELVTEGPVFVKGAGAGIGFDTLLSGLFWRSV